MATPHKGSEFNNIIEQWEENERKKENAPGAEGAATEPSTGSALNELIKQEASEYDSENKENRVLTGDRATINDEAESNPSEE